jgi:hypothetical protein
MKEWWQVKAEREWAEIVTNGKRFETVDNSGYLYKGKKHYDWIRGPTITGPDYPFPDQPIVKSENPWHK